MLTPAERRGALVVALLLALGAAHDLWRASRPLPADTPASAGPAAPAPPPGHGAAADPAPAATPRPLVDLNRAGAHELESLPGVGPVLTRRILAHRERHGPFRHPEELLAVRGIGPRLFERLRPRVAVAAEDPPGAAPSPARRDRRGAPRRRGGRAAVPCKPPGNPPPDMQIPLQSRRAADR